jgi:F-type H+-transporting ATPase subunit gamma
MKIVASTKLTRAQRAMTNSRSYGQNSNTVFEQAETKPIESADDSKTLLIICSSDKGLCGGIHSGMSRYARRLIIENPNLELAIVGEKCKSQLSRSNPKNMVLSFNGIGKDIPTFADASAIADQVVSLPTQYSSVQILYNKFVNASSFEPTIVEAYSEEAIQESRKFFRCIHNSITNNISKLCCF